MSEDIFHTSCKLPRDGLNPHRLKIEKDVPLKDVEALFGAEKGRNGFLITERLTPALRTEVESLYCQIYQKTHSSTHVGKELAMGWTLQTQGRQINWAGFAAETNVGQQKAFSRRVKTWLIRLAQATNQPLSEIVQTEPISKYLDVKDEKKPCIQLFQGEEAVLPDAANVKRPQMPLRTPTLTDACRAQRAPRQHPQVQGSPTGHRQSEGSVQGDGPPVLDFASAGIGAPSVSATDSTFTKLLGQEKYSSSGKAVGHGKIAKHVSPRRRILQGDGNCNPFGSKCSSASAAVKHTIPSTPSSHPSRGAVHIPIVDPTSTKELDEAATLTPASLASTTTTMCHVQVATPADAAEFSVGNSNMQFGRKKDEVNALELEFQQLDAHKSGFSDHDEDPSDVEALFVDGGRPEEEGRKDSEPHADEDPWDITIGGKLSPAAKSGKSAQHLPPVNSRAPVENSGGDAVLDPIPSPLKAHGKSPSSGKGGNRTPKKCTGAPEGSRRQLWPRIASTPLEVVPGRARSPGKMDK